MGQPHRRSGQLKTPSLLVGQVLYSCSRYEDTSTLHWCFGKGLYAQCTMPTIPRPVSREVSPFGVRLTPMLRDGRAGMRKAVSYPLKSFPADIVPLAPEAAFEVGCVMRRPGGLTFPAPDERVWRAAFRG